MTDFCLFQSYLLSQNGNNTVLLMLFVINSFCIFSVNIISLHQEVRGIFVIKAALEMQNNLPFCD